MSDKARNDQLPVMPQPVQMPPFCYQRDARTTGGGVAGGRPARKGATGVLVGSNLCG